MLKSVNVTGNGRIRRIYRKSGVFKVSEDGFCPEYSVPALNRRCKVEKCPHNYNMYVCPHYAVDGSWIENPNEIDEWGIPRDDERQIPKLNCKPLVVFTDE